MAKSGYGQLGFMSVLHATYLRCIKPYINNHTVSLEIGPGRGAWTKALLPSKEIYVLDALPEEHNRFFEYLEYPKNVRYFQVKDFDCEILPDNYFNYMF
jgi:16S rRNA A1518/A1519 N6-dimethyltransferase RsmA/KsgA/DIM1 with predicted DNA glycosylase/AP lyase activity